MLFEYGKRTRDFFEVFLFIYFLYEMIIANSALCASLAIYHLISNARLLFNKLTSVFHVSVLLLIMNFVTKLS